MPDFSKYTNYQEQSAFSGVVFGAQAPVLEVELNEVQQIFDTKLRRLSRAIGDVLFVDVDGTIAFDKESGTLSLRNCLAILNGLTATIPSVDLVVTPEHRVVYIKLEERVFSSTDTLKSYGNVDGASVPNTMTDTRVGAETSRRRVTQFSIVCADEVPANASDTQRYLEIGTLVGGDEETSGDFVFKNIYMKSVIENFVTIQNQLEVINTTIDNLPATLASIGSALFGLTIPTIGWELDTDTNGMYRYHIDIPQASIDKDLVITDDLIPEIRFSPQSMSLVVASKISSVCQTLEGKLRIYADIVPTTEITADLIILHSTTVGTNSSSKLKIATYTTPGVVKPGVGLLISEDGTLSLDVATTEDLMSLFNPPSES